MVLAARVESSLEVEEWAGQGQVVSGVRDETEGREGSSFGRWLDVTGRTERVWHAAGVAVCFDEVAAFDVWLEV